MVFRRPYAFLIKYFRLIHIILFILFAYITFKANSILTFFKDYINYLKEHFDYTEKYEYMLITEICKTGDDCYYYGLRVR